MTGPAQRESLHPLHRLWRWLPREARRAALFRAAVASAPRPDRVPPAAAPGLAIAGELDRPSGLGEAARLLLGAVSALGLPAYPVQRGGPVAPPGVPLLLVGTGSSLPLELLRLGRRHLRGRLLVGQWFWELPVVPAAWRRALPLLHRLWAPSAFVAAALRPLAGELPIVRLPVATRPPSPAPLPRAAFDLPDDAVVTVASCNLASGFERKNPLGAVAAHRRAFGDRADRVLLVHAINPHHFPAETARLEAACGGNVRLHTAALSRADSLSLLQMADIVLSLHRSEGFGLVPAEAMLLGKPVVATDWSATAEFLDAGCGAPVPARLVPAQDGRGVFGGAAWAEPDEAAAAAALRRLADDPAERVRLGAAARAAATERLGADTLRAAIAALA